MVSEFQAQSINVNSLKEAAIHVCSQIQPHGVLLVLGEPELNILQISSNTWSVFGILPEDVLQKNSKIYSTPSKSKELKQAY